MAESVKRHAFSVLAFLVRSEYSWNMSERGEKLAKAEEKVQQLLYRKVQKDKDVHNAFLLVDSKRLGIHWNFAAGTSGTDKKVATTPEHSFHIASIGKTFNSILIGILYQKGVIDYNDPISKYLPPGIIENIHVYKGQNYSDRILVRHLLNHTSGIADYFNEKPKKGKKIIELVLEDPSHFWTPGETIQWARDNLEAHFPPGEGFHYTDTGYQLIGLIIEKITGKALHEVLNKSIFSPLKMKHSYLMFYSEPEEKKPFANLFVGDQDISNHRSLSIDWAGGGIVSTTEDLLLFIQALVNHSLIKEETFKRMQDWAKFGRGIYYGYGLMYFKFKEIFFLLSDKLDMWGNSGSIGSYMYYCPKLDMYIIGNFNQTKYEKKHVNFIIRVLNVLAKL
jgi:D-alanyl-D-alanine carboxypeptidase